LIYCISVRTENTETKERLSMNWLLTTYVGYLVISICLTIWVARTLHKNGRIFLVDSFLGNEQLADSVNHLLVVGFYLINIGYVALALKGSAQASNAQEALEALSGKIGLVLLVLGAMHFFNLAVFAKMRKRALTAKEPPPLAVAGLARGPVQ
jgi:hypothetical protein